MAKAKITVRLTEQEPFKAFYENMIVHMTNYAYDEYSESEILKRIHADFIKFSEAIGGDVRFLKREDDNV